MSLGLVDLVGVEDLRSEMIRELRLGINWMWDCGGAAAPLGLW